MFDSAGSEARTEQQLRVAAALSNIAPAKTLAYGGNLTWVPVRERGPFLRTDGQGVSLRRSVFPLLEGECYAFEVADSAMLPAYPPGCYVIGSRLPNYFDVVPGVVYLVQTNEQIVLGAYEGFKGELYRFGFTGSTGCREVDVSDIQHVYHIEYRLAKP